MQAMTGPEHNRRAERLMASVMRTGPDGRSESWPLGDRRRDRTDRVSRVLLAWRGNADGLAP